MTNYIIFHFNQNSSQVETYPVSAPDNESAVDAAEEYINTARQNENKPPLAEGDFLVLIEDNHFDKITENFKAFRLSNNTHK